MTVEGDNQLGDRYALGYDAETQQLLARRTADSCAHFLLPHLRPGMTLLDCGCGPATITVGLAEAIAPGEVAAIDLDEEQLDAARAHAEAVGASNIRFQTASARALPFDDEAFDVVFFHAVLCYFPDPLVALAEARRVLRPGGVVAVRDIDVANWYAVPTDPVRDRFSAIYAGLVESDGGDARIGRRLRPLLHQAGFDSTIGSASFAHYGEPDRVRAKCLGTAELWGGDGFAAKVTELALTDATELRQIVASFRELAERPDAFFAEAWGEAVGWKPRTSSS